MTSKPSDFESDNDGRNGSLGLNNGLLSVLDRRWLIGFTIAAILLYCINLGALPLRDWDEGTRALVAREMLETGHWLHPTQYGLPYMLKPPLMDWLVALGFKTFGVNEWAARLPGAIASAAGVPLLYLLGRSVCQRRSAAVLSAGVFLTLLPVARHGRLLMLDGMAVTAFLLVLLGIARSRRKGGEQWAVGIGVGMGWLVLTKGLLAVPLGGIALMWWGWLQIANRQQRSYRAGMWLCVGVLLGCGAVASWYGAQFARYGSEFWNTHFWAQGLDRVSDTVEEHQGPPWYYLLELLKYGWPWLLFWPVGLKLAWQERRQAWGALVLVGTVGYLGTISIMGTKLPWYIMPVYPFVALAIGQVLDGMWNSASKLRRGWPIAVTVLGAAVVAGTVYLVVDGAGRPWLPLLGVVLSGTLVGTARLMWQRRRLFVPVMLVGTYLSLACLMLSSEWLWELNEAFSVPPVAEIVRSNVPTNRVMYTSFGYDRPSLNFYCHCQVRSASVEQLRELMGEEYVLVERQSWPEFKAAGARELDGTDEFVLMTTQ